MSPHRLVPLLCLLAPVSLNIRRTVTSKNIYLEFLLEVFNSLKGADDLPDVKRLLEPVDTATDCGFRLVQRSLYRSNGINALLHKWAG